MGGMAQVLSGRPKAKESSWTTRETRGAGAPFPHRKDAITEGKIFRTWHWVTRIELDYDRSAELHYVIGLKD